MQKVDHGDLVAIGVGAPLVEDRLPQRVEVVYRDRAGTIWWATESAADGIVGWALEPEQFESMVGERAILRLPSEVPALPFGEALLLSPTPPTVIYEPREVLRRHRLEHAGPHIRKALDASASDPGVATRASWEASVLVPEDASLRLLCASLGESSGVAGAAVDRADAGRALLSNENWRVEAATTWAPILGDRITSFVDALDAALTATPGPVVPRRPSTHSAAVGERVRRARLEVAAGRDDFGALLKPALPPWDVSALERGAPELVERYERDLGVVFARLESSRTRGPASVLQAFFRRRDSLLEVDDRVMLTSARALAMDIGEVQGESDAWISHLGSGRMPIPKPPTEYRVRCAITRAAEASTWLRSVGLVEPGQPIPSMRDLLRGLGVRIVVGYLGRADIDAITFMDPVMRAPMVFVNFSGPARKSLFRRFVLAHELYHLLYDRRGGGTRPTLSTITGRVVGSEEVEQVADAFAANFLAPESLFRALAVEEGVLPHGVHELPDPDAVRRIMERIGLNYRSVAFRLQQVGALSENEVERLQRVDTSDSARWDFAEALEDPWEDDLGRSLGIAPERCGRFAREVAAAHRAARLSASRARTLWGLPSMTSAAAVADALLGDTPSAMG